MASGRVEGKRIAVIGAGSIGPGWGNGKAAAVLYAREGGRVLCVDRDAAAAQLTAELISAEGGAAETQAGDMTSEADVAALAARLDALWGGVDIVHFNIGVSEAGGVVDVTPESWDRVLAVNLRAAMLVAKTLSPGMRAQGSGAFVFISSIAAIKCGAYSYISYEASKAALCRLSASIAAESAPFGVRSNTILPGLIDTPHVAAYISGGADPAKVDAERASRAPMGRQGTAWDVAEAALFLASDAAGYITGVDLRVDGGLAL